MCEGLSVCVCVFLCIPSSKFRTFRCLWFYFQTTGCICGISVCTRACMFVCVCVCMLILWCVIFTPAASLYSSCSYFFTVCVCVCDAAVTNGSVVDRGVCSIPLVGHSHSPSHIPSIHVFLFLLFTASPSSHHLHSPAPSHSPIHLHLLLLHCHITLAKLLDIFLFVLL